MPYDPHKDGMRNTVPGAAIPHVSYRSEAAQPPAQPAAQPSARPARPAKPRRRPVARRRSPYLGWKYLLSIGLLLPLFGGGIFWLLLPRSPASSETAENTQPAVIYVTATQPSSIMLTATFVLPPEYLQSLSATPGAPSIFAAAPTPTLAFQQATPATPPFTLAGTKIVYVCHFGKDDGDDEICIMNADGTNQQRLTYLNATDYYPSLTPDGQTILFASQRGRNKFDVYAMGADGSNIRQLTDTPDVDEYAPEMSPDGSRIVYSREYILDDEKIQSIWVMNADGSNQHAVTSIETNAIDPSWSPDGTMISFTSNRSGTNELFIMNADGSNAMQVTTRMSVRGRNDWSPDGRWLTFYAGRGSKTEIYIVPVECGYIGAGCDRALIFPLTFDSCSKGPAFSPDGQWITFATNHCSRETEDNEVAIIRLDGSGLTVLTNNTIGDYMARWGW